MKAKHRFLRLLGFALILLFLPGCTGPTSEKEQLLSKRQKEVKQYGKQLEGYFNNSALAEDQASILLWIVKGNPLSEPVDTVSDKYFDRIAQYGHQIVTFWDYSKYVELMRAYMTEEDIPEVIIEWRNISQWPIDWIQFKVYYVDGSGKPIALAHNAVEGIEDNKIIRPDETGRTKKLVDWLETPPSEAKEWSGQFGVEVKALLFETPKAEITAPNMQVVPSK